VLERDEFVIVGRDPDSVRFGGDLVPGADAGVHESSTHESGIHRGYADDVDDPAPRGQRPAHRHAA
jgi:hypothetical protein